jgi:L,D-transpeptidase catalytic domain
VGSNPTPSASPPAGGAPATDGVSTLVSVAVIEPEQLADALERLDPRERELLALSLRRRVPDDALARVYDVDSQEVARRRAGAIERLADELGAQRGEDLGAVLQALLDEGTWSAAESAEGGETPSVEETEILPEGESAATAVEEPQAPEPESTNGHPPVVAVASEPVLEMLAAREGVRGPDGEAEAGAPSRRRRVPYLVILASFVAALIGGAAALVGSSEWGDDGGAKTLRDSGDGTRHFVPQLGGPLEAPFPSEPQSISCYSTALLTEPATLYREPGGRPRIHLSKRTEWGSSRVLGVVLRRGDWVAVQAPELGNGELAWLSTSRARLDCVPWSVHADLSRRMLYVRHDGKVVKKFQIAIGRRGNSTPIGRFAVTDKLRVTDPGSPYGCCVLALTGHQNRLPPGWPGGDRLAIHATKELSSIGKPASLGCLRITSVQALWLIKTIPAGSPVFVRA